MSFYHLLLWFLIGLAAFNLIYKIIRKVEGFEDSVDPELQLRNEVNGQMTSANDTLCPIYKELLQNRVDTNLTDKEDNLANRCAAKSKALESIKKDTSNLLFPCPPPTDPMKVPNDIDKYIEKTSIVLISFLDDIKKNIEKSLSCPPKKEKFEDKPQTQEKPDECATIPADVSNLPPEKAQRIQALQLKSNALKRGLENPLFLSLINKYNELKELKAKAESGKLTPNCPS